MSRCVFGSPRNGLTPHGRGSKKDDGGGGEEFGNHYMLTCI